MSTSMPRSLETQSFPPLSPPASAVRTVFANGVEAEVSEIVDRKCIPRDDCEVLAASLGALRGAMPRRRALR